MRVRFWGTRGSIPVALTAPQIRHKLITAFTRAMGQQLDSTEKITSFVDHELGFDVAGTFGGHSSCVEIDAGQPESGEHLICDMGSGARPLGQAMMSRFGPAAGQTYHVFMSHLHWDHIMGFPFFTPVYVPGNRIVMHGCHAELEHAFRRQQAAPSFPVEFSQLAATIEFDILAPGETREIAGFRVTPKKQLHGGDSYGYRFERDGKVVVYSTDSEHKLENAKEFDAFVQFFRNADLVIFDAMYSLAESISVKADWGHSSNVVGVELCQLAGARRLCMFHHEPASDDTAIATLLAETKRFEEITREGAVLEVLTAYDGLEVIL